MTGVNLQVTAGALMGAALALSTACAPNHNDEAGPMAADTLRGVVEVTGAEPLTRVAVRTGTGAVPLTGPAADGLRQAQGVEVWVAGTRDERGDLEVERYRVRAVDGVQATDGVLEVEGAAAVLVTATGDRVRFEPAPTRLREMAGRHIWIAGDPGGEPQAWGLLEPDR